MIKTNVDDNKKGTKVNMSGSLNELMNDFKAISQGMRELLTDDFGKEDGEAIFDVLSSDSSDGNVVEEVQNIIYKHIKKEFMETRDDEEDISKFEPGKKYVFDKELFKKAESETGEVSLWVKQCDGKEVLVLSKVGVIGPYLIKPEWCREVE